MNKTEAKKYFTDGTATAKEYKKRAGFYRRHKQDYANKLIPYDSPSGTAYIGIAKHPLMPNKDGHGFQGVVIQDDTRRYIQCSACGKWLQKIGHRHLNKCSGLTMDEYKEKYKLNKTEGLVSDELSLRLTKQALKNKSAERIRKYAGTGQVRKHNTKRTRQMENQHGTCPKQVEYRLYEFIWCNRELPGRDNKGQALYKILWKRFGTFGNGLRHYGLPHYKRKGTNYYYTFPDHTIYKYNINQMDGREALFAMIQQKCPRFTEFINKQKNEENNQAK